MKTSAALNPVGEPGYPDEGRLREFILGVFDFFLGAPDRRQGLLLQNLYPGVNRPTAGVGVRRPFMAWTPLAMWASLHGGDGVTWTVVHTGRHGGTRFIHGKLDAPTWAAGQEAAVAAACLALAGNFPNSW